jgi:hypothetical protein
VLVLKYCGYSLGRREEVVKPLAIITMEKILVVHKSTRVGFVSREEQEHNAPGAIAVFPT